MINSNSPFEKGFIKDPTQLALQPNDPFCPRITEVIIILVSYTTHQPLFLSDNVESDQVETIDLRNSLAILIAVARTKVTVPNLRN